MVVFCRFSCNGSVRHIRQFGSIVIVMSFTYKLHGIKY